MEQRKRRGGNGSHGQAAGQRDEHRTQRCHMAEHHEKEQRQRHTDKHQRGETTRRFAQAKAAGIDDDPIGQAAVTDGRDPYRKRGQRKQQPGARAVRKAHQECGQRRKDAGEQ